MTESTNFTTFEVNDIVCGRGKGFDSYPGNKLFRSIINKHAVAYSSESTNRKDKTMVIKKILFELKANNARFIRRKKNSGWTMLSEREVQMKISHALRDVHPIRKKQESRKRIRMNSMKLRQKQNSDAKRDESENLSSNGRRISFAEEEMSWNGDQSTAFISTDTDTPAEIFTFVSLDPSKFVLDSPGQLIEGWGSRDNGFVFTTTRKPYLPCWETAVVVSDASLVSSNESDDSQVDFAEIFNVFVNDGDVSQTVVV